jgi:hypothetical protein
LPRLANDCHVGRNNYPLNVTFFPLIVFLLDER